MSVCLTGCVWPAGYHAPLDLYPEFHRIAKDPSLHSVPEGRLVSVCVGKEWYRYPSSFLLPNKSVCVCMCVFVCVMFVCDYYFGIRYIVFD